MDALENDPRNHLAHRTICSCYLGLNDLERAETHIIKALRINRADKESHILKEDLEVRIMEFMKVNIEKYV
jgi:hypothetical protein